MTDAVVVGVFPEVRSRPLSAIEIQVIPIDLVTEWPRCGMIADFMADYMVHGFERRDTARSVLSTVVNELVENAAKFSREKRAAAHVSIRHHGDSVHAEIRNEAGDVHVRDLRELLGDLARDDARLVFERRLRDRRGLGLALLARDYRAIVGATIASSVNGGSTAVCLRVALSAAEVEQR